MLPSRGLAQAGRGLVVRRQILSRNPVRSIPRQAISIPTAASPRQFGTSFRSHDRQSPIISAMGFRSGYRIGAAGPISSQINLLSSRRFASTESNTIDSSAAGATPSSELNTDFSSFPGLDDASLLNIPEQVGYLSQLGLDYGWGPTSMCQWALEHLHITAGLPWWASIVGVAVVIRLVMFYPIVISQKETEKAREMQQNPLYKEVLANYYATLAKRHTANQNELVEARMQMSVMRENMGNVKVWKQFLAFLQFPFALGMFKLTRGMAALPVPGLETAGFLWIPDLTMPDPFYILPCLSTVMMVLSMKRATPFMTPQQATIMEKLPWILGPITIAATLGMSSSVQFFFVATAILQYLQGVLFSVPVLREVCGLAPQQMLNKDDQKASSATKRGGMHYQAPRTINTTATEQRGAKEKNPASEEQPGFFEDLKTKFGAITSSFSNADDKAGKEYETRRRREENDNFSRRKRENRVKQEQKKKAKRT